MVGTFCIWFVVDVLALFMIIGDVVFPDGCMMFMLPYPDVPELYDMPLFVALTAFIKSAREPAGAEGYIIAALACAGVGVVMGVTRCTKPPWYMFMSVVDAALFVGVAGVAYFVLKTDYLTEGLIGFGVGWTLNALL